MAQIRTREITEEELNKILGNVERADIKLALFLEANMGLRISDTVNITREMIKNKYVILIENKTKKENRRDITADESLMLLNYIDTHSIRFTQNISSFSRAVQREIKRACLKADIDSTYISTHSFRKFYATTVYNSTQDILLVSKLLNHGSIATTQRYLGVDKEKLKEHSFLGKGIL